MTTAVTARASFVIYKDEPAPSSRPKSTPPSPSTQPIRLPTAGDKENLHPVTGERPSSEQPFSKKRKTGVLATKLIITKSKSSKDDKEAQPSPKKRKLSRTNSKSTTGEKEKKEKRAIALRRAKGSGPSRTRKLPELPIVHEEVDDEKEVEELLLNSGDIAQAAVDAKCYELTVLPLADISKAYEDTPALRTKAVAAATKTEKSGEKDDESGDVNESLLPSVAPVSTVAQNTSLPSPSEKKTSVFSTPERKRIYSAFTFSSPSAAGERYFVSRGSSMDRFSDLDYDPILDRVS